MDSFLDSTVIIKYFEYDYIKEQLRKKCFEYIKSSNEKIFISFIVKDELNRVILQRKEIYECVLKKIRDPGYELDYKNTIYLNKQDTLFVQELYLKLKDKDINRLKQDFDSEVDFLKASLDLFLKNKVNEIAINKSELNDFVLSVIHDFMSDFADSRVLTSAIQMQKNKDIFFFVTADKHFSPNEYKFIKDEPRLKEYKFPELKNLLYENGRT
jgi:predicted nucleic acid-binding protein